MTNLFSDLGDDSLVHVYTIPLNNLVLNW